MTSLANWERVEFWENYSTLKAIREILFPGDEEGWQEFKQLLKSYNPLLGKAPIVDSYWYYCYLNGFSLFLDDNLDYFEVREEERRAFNLPSEVEYAVIEFYERDWPEVVYFNEEAFHQLEKEIELDYAQREREGENEY